MFTNSKLIFNGKDKNPDGSLKNEHSQAAIAIIDYKTGQVKVLIGGRGNQPPTSLNRAYFDLKSIGSTTKPVTNSKNMFKRNKRW